MLSNGYTIIINKLNKKQIIKVITFTLLIFIIKSTESFTEVQSKYIVYYW